MANKRWIQDEAVYYDRTIINKIYGSGFHLTNDLLPLYHMASYFNKYANLSRQAKQRIKWFDYYRKRKNASLTCRCFGISRKTFHKWKNRIDSFSKVAFARMYKNANSYNASDFLNRLMYLVNGNIDNIQTDNGSEFGKYFNQACVKLKLGRYYSRVRTPKDNPVNERFNRTIQCEFINLGNFTPDVVKFNRNVTEWLIEYNFNRPHESLNYETPINFNNSAKVLPMYPSGIAKNKRGLTASF
ncbi:MAG: hypothetical protein US76_00350 [Parcubacteria group bacterium GW2011_GWA2_38_13b]|nr:MAG: hypothetical protein US76_00350 [Parcubacteria group bacterium GW2011_GWA2_38_13b]